MAGSFTTRRVNSTQGQGQALALRVQTTIQGLPRPIVYGQTRLAGTLIDYDGFKAYPHYTPHGGKGGAGGGGSGKGSSGSWNYFAGGIVSLGEPIADVIGIFNGTQVNYLRAVPTQILYDLATIGVTPIFGNWVYGAAVHNGQGAQSPDGGWAAQFGAARALAYRGEATVVFETLSLGTSPTFPNFNFEVLGVINSDIPALGPDANPADVIADLLTNAGYGVPGFPASALASFDNARLYWRAAGLMVSYAVAGGIDAQGLLGYLMKALNADFRWSNGQLDIVPYADQPVSGNGYAWTPDLTPVYALGVDNFLPLSGGAAAKTAVQLNRKSLNDICNAVRAEYLDRSVLYDPVTIYATDDASIAATGRLKMSDLRQNHFFALASAASQSVALQLARESAELNTYKCRVGRQFILLDPMDIVSLTEPALQLEAQLCRITEIEENDDRTLTLTLIEVPGTASAPIYGRQPSLGTGANANVPAPNANAPIFFEPPDQLGGGLVLWIGLSGQTPSAWGGCDVYLSSDGETYAQIGSFHGQSRMGVTTSAITAVAASTSASVTIDSANTPGVNLAESGAALASGSAADLSAFNTAFVVDSEVMAYQAAALTAANAYTLSPIARGGYGSTIAAHAAGAPFLRLDGNVFAWAFDASRIGAPLYFKFVAFNPLGGGGQNIAAVGAYAYTPTGAALSTPLPDIVDVYTNFANGFQQIFWDEVKDFRSGVVYEIRQGSSWAAALPMRTQAHPPFIAQGDGTFWIAAKCAPLPGLTVYSETPASVTIAGNQLTSNLVFGYDEQAAGWPGTAAAGMVVQGTGSAAVLALGPAPLTTDTAIYYTSAHVIDIGYVAHASVSASTTITGSPLNQNVLSVANILAAPDILSAASAALVNGWVEVNVALPTATDVFSFSDIYAPTDIFAGASPNWGGWQKLVPGVFLGRYFQFRLALETTDPETAALALSFSYAVQVPARIDHYQGLAVPSTGLAILFRPDGAAQAPFNGGPAGAALPYVNVSWAGSAGDYYALTAFTVSGLTVTFYDSAGTAVARSGVNIDVEGY